MTIDNSQTGRDAPPRRRRSAFSIAWKVVAIAIAIAVIVWANRVAIGNERILESIARFGYVGVFIAAAISGFNLLVPIPAIALFPLIVQAGLHPVIAVAVIAAGMTTGDMLGYALGRLGRRLVENPRWLRWLSDKRERHRLAPYVILFVNAGFSPLPNEVFVIPMALIGCTWYGVLAAALSGNLIFNSLMAAGITTIFDLF